METWPKRDPMSTEVDENALRATTDAAVWARAFLRVVHDLDGDFDEGFVIGWFANAIETGRAAGFKDAREL